ncbi:MAG: HEAT repeat domain-containing protein [Desulfobacteraceae bacterium]
MAKTAINLKYRSAERFYKDYIQLRKGQIFLPAKKVLPRKTIIALHITVPEINRVFVANGAVISSIDLQTSEKLNKPPGMLVAIIGGPNSIIAELNSALRNSEHYRNILGLTEPKTRSESPVADPTDMQLSSTKEKIPADSKPEIQKAAETASPKAPLTQPKPAQKPATQRSATNEAEDRSSMDEEDLPDDMLGDPEDADLSIAWLKEAVAQEEVTIEKEPEPEVAVPPTTEKNNLTIAEREKVKPVAEFIMDLTKAMLRSGYYSTDHPGAQDAKRGLYDAFQKSLGDSNEIMITSQETREQSDILITGILDEPVNVRTLVGAGMAELFVPKLREYFNRKGLVSFAIKKSISLEHFEGFVDIMSDPKADRGENSKVGELLSNALVERGITEISTVFMDDMIALELNLPWRVEMAIQRLAKDLKVLPMFKSRSDDAIREMKLQIIQDIIRPLKHPEFLKDLIINCYIIAKHVETVDTKDIEKVIIEAFPLETLLPTSRYIFDELNHLRELNAETPDNPVLLRRFTGVKRILIWVSRRLVLADVRGAQGFLEQLYVNEILTFEELPADAQYLVNTMKIANDVQTNFSSYLFRIMNVDTVENAAVLIKCFRRIMPVFIEHADWETILTITKAFSQTARDNKVFNQDAGLPSKPHKFIFKDLTTELYEAYIAADESQRQVIGRIAAKLGAQGIEILSRVLSDCDDRTVRKDATDFLIQKGDMARRWVLKVLDDPNRPWYLQRNALMILRYVGKGKDDIDRARKLLGNSHPRLRDEALNTVLTLKASDAEQLVIEALNDPDDKVRWRATSALTELSPLTESSIEQILNMITTDPPEEDAIKHIRKVSQLITSLGVLDGLRNLVLVEDTLLVIAQKLSEQKKGILKRLKKSSETDQTPIISATITTLGKIGTPKSEAFLAKLAGSKTNQAEPAQKAVDNIRMRYAKQAANAPASA